MKSKSNPPDLCSISRLSSVFFCGCRTAPLGTIAKQINIRTQPENCDFVFIFEKMNAKCRLSGWPTSKFPKGGGYKMKIHFVTTPLFKPAYLLLNDQSQITRQVARLNGSDNCALKFHAGQQNSVYLTAGKINSL